MSYICLKLYKRYEKKERKKVTLKRKKRKES